MCMIISKPKNVKLPKEEYILESSYSNSDGIGIMYIKDNEKQVHLKKDFKDVYELLDFLDDNITEKDILVIHFRYATSGRTDKGNRHPFPITRNMKRLRKTKLVCDRAIAHNGVISKYHGHKKYSDTQKFIMGFLADMNIRKTLNHKKTKKRIKNFIKDDRLSILTSDDGLILIGQHIKANDNCYYSNGGYKPILTKKKQSYIEVEGINEKEIDNYLNKHQSEDLEVCDNCFHYFPYKDMVKIDSYIFCETCGKYYLNSIYPENSNKKEKRGCYETIS